MLAFVMSVLFSVTIVGRTSGAECRCNDFVTSDNYGKCLRNDKLVFDGSPYCYVTLPSGCTDLIKTSIDPGMGRSAEACTIPGSKSLDDIFTEISSLETQMQSFNKKLQTMESKIESLDETMESKIESLDKKIENQHEGLDKSMEMILDQGNRQDILIDPCLTAQYLNESWRHIDYIDRGDKSNMCDKRGNTQEDTGMIKGWFRFGSAAGSRLPTFRSPRPSPSHDNQICGATKVAYIARGGHPTPAEGIVTREVCFQETDSDNMIGDCYGRYGDVKNEPIKVAACSDENGEYYVYELQPVTDCSSAYCALDEKTKICPTWRPFHCKSGECISEQFRCDGIEFSYRAMENCPDGSDEEDCHEYVCPADRPFHCKSGECIMHMHRCDGKSECKDGSDEEDCQNFVCPTDMFQCNSGHCLKKLGRCNGIYQCDDLSDEENCQDHVCPFAEFEYEYGYGYWLFQCKNGACVRQDYRCNGKTDCLDNSDEEDCQDFDVTMSEEYDVDGGNWENEHFDYIG